MPNYNVVRLRKELIRMSKWTFENDKSTTVRKWDERARATNEWHRELKNEFFLLIFSWFNWFIFLKVCNFADYIGCSSILRPSSHTTCYINKNWKHQRCIHNRLDTESKRIFRWNLFEILWGIRCRWSVLL